MMPAMTRNVVIVDDHSAFREQARQLLEGMGYRVVGEAATGAEALHLSHRLRPDVVLLDIQLPDIDGISVAKSLTSTSGAPAVILISTRDRADYGPRLNGSGAAGFIAKSDLTADALEAMLQP
jgi:DNA-binding NarL/FixJ family response regulator